MLVEIGSMTSLSAGQKIYDLLKEDDKVLFVFLEAGRSNDLFDEKQFGEFGEAAIVTILADSRVKDAIFNKIYQVCELHSSRQGLVFMTPDVLKTSTK